MDLTEMLSILWRSKWIILITALLAAAITGVISFQKQTVYSAEAVLITGNTGSAGQSVTADKQAATYASLVDIREVLDKSIEVSGIGSSAQALRADVSASTEKDSPYIILSSVSYSAETAVNEVNAVAQGLTQYVSELQTQAYSDTRQLIVDELTKVQAQQDTARAANPNDPRILALEDVRLSLMKQYEQMNIEKVSSDQIKIVSLARESASSPPHNYRDIILAFVIGAVVGIGIGFVTDSIRKALGRLPDKS